MSVKIKQARLSIEELHELKWLMGGCLTLLSLWSLWSLDLQSELFLLLGSLVVIAALILPARVAQIPVAVWRPAGFVLLFVVGADFVLHLPEFMPPLLRMVILLLVYRTLAPRRRRDDLQVVLLCLFCVVISGVLTVSLLFAFQILLFTPIAMGLLFVVCLLDRGPESRSYLPSWQSFRWSSLVRRVVRVVDFRVLFLGAALFGFVVLVSTVLFVLTPRFNLDQVIPYLQIKSEARSGFSENVKLGAVSEIIEDTAVAMRIDVPSLEAIDAAPYWRILVLDKYDKGYFRMSDELKRDPFARYKKEREWLGRDLVGSGVSKRDRRGEIWTFYLEGATTQYLPIPGQFYSLRFEGLQDIVVMADLHVLGLDSVRQSVFSYQIEDLQWSRRLPASEEEQSAFSILPMTVEGDAPGYPLTTMELKLESEDAGFLRDLNQQILPTDGALGAAAYSQAATDYLWQNFRYSLSPDGSVLAADPVVDWLREGQAGHCEYFAGAFVLLARAAGYPARMVVGFAGGSWNVVESYFVVRNSDAHAWVEIYDAATSEWLRVDPTPGSGSSNPDLAQPTGVKFEAGWSAWLDSLRIQWYRRIVNFDQADQVEMASTLKDVWDEWVETFSLQVKSALSRVKEWVARPFSRGNFIRAGFVLVCGVGLFFLWRTRYGWLGLLYRMLRRPQALDPVRKQAGRYLRRLKASGVDAPVARDLEALRFGPAVTPSVAKSVFVNARRALRRRS
jgi:transglutaminase-like putative cysteine protease